MKKVITTGHKGNKPQIFASWSGGKDGCLALYRAMRNGMEARYLANMVTEDGQRSCSHGILAAVIKKQSEAIGIPIVQKPTTHETYEAVFVETIKELKGEGIEGGVFGDIDFSPHREWIERVCKKAGITPHLPLWNESQSKLMEEFIEAGFKAVVVAVKAELFGKEVLGRVVDRKFLDYLTGLDKPITPCGEAGEYHTLVVDGPIFKKRLEIVKSEKVTRGEHHFLEILETELKTKKNRKTLNMTKIIARVVSQKGVCEAGHRVGDEFVIGQTTPPGMCSWAFYTLFPFAESLQFGGTFPWEKDPDKGKVACPDADNPVVFELRRVE